MGLKDSASAFQSRIQQTLQGLPGCEAYIDDIIIHGPNQEVHDSRLRVAFKRLRDAGFRLQPDKLRISQATVKAFGHIISASGIKPDPSNVKPVLTVPVPKNVKDVQSFLGMVNYFQEFLQDLPTISEPLRALTRKEAKFQWTSKEDLSFRTIKSMLAKQTILHLFDPDAITFMTTDASDIGIGALLSQKDTAAGPERPIAFFSQTLDQSERNYAANEREALACMKACENWENLLLGRHFTLRTDHKSLESMLGKPKNRRQSSKFSRWMDRMSEFDYTMEYVPGPHNQVADYFSRLLRKANDLGVGTEKDPVNEALKIGGVTLQSIRKATSEDPIRQTLQRAIESNDWSPFLQAQNKDSRTFRTLRTSLQFKDGVIFKGQKILVPETIRKHVLQETHAGHPGIVRLKALLRTIYWWPGMDQQAETMVRSCEPCQCSTKSRPAIKSAKEPRKIPRPQAAGKQVAIDITGPFVNGNYYVVLIDYYSHWPEVLQTKDTSSQNIIKWLKKVWDAQGYPSAVVSDNGPQFTSATFTKFLQDKDIHHYTTSVYNPQEKGLVEGWNRYFKHGVQAFSEQASWKEGLNKLITSYRHTPGPSGKSPAEIHYGRKVRPECIPNISRPWRRTRQMKRAEPETNQMGWRENLPYLGPSVYRKGEQVLSRIPWVPKGISPWSGPKTVERVLGSYTFRLSDGQDWHARNLKPWIRNEDRIYTFDEGPDQQPPPPCRRSTHRNFGIPPKRLICDTTFSWLPRGNPPNGFGRTDSAGGR